MDYFENCNNVVVQCGENAGADAVCAAFALERYICSLGKTACIVCAGTALNESVKAAVKQYGIVLLREYPADYDLIVAVDFQYGRNSGGLVSARQVNTVSFDCHREDVAAVSGAAVGMTGGCYRNIVVCNSAVSSTCSVVWQMFLDNEYEPDETVQSALYCGLYCASNALAELNHPLDRDLIETFGDSSDDVYENSRAMYESDLKAGEFADGRMCRIIANALLNVVTVSSDVGNRKIEAGLFRADAALETGTVSATPVFALPQGAVDSAGSFMPLSILNKVCKVINHLDTFDCIIVYCENEKGDVRASCLSRIREIMADEILNFLFGHLGSVHGNTDRASGSINIREHAYELYGGYAEITTRTYLEKRLRDYSETCDLIYCGPAGDGKRGRELYSSEISFGSMDRYMKTPMPIGYVKTADVFPGGTEITARTLEGDVDAVAGDNTYLMIGALGEVYPIKREKFEFAYKPLDDTYDMETVYTPSLINRTTGERRSMGPYARLCMPSGDKIIRAMPITKYTKVFSYWDLHRYFFGKPGDYLAAGETDTDDCYIVRGDIFLKTYENVRGSGITKLYSLMNTYENAAFVDQLTGMQNRNAYLARLKSFCSHANMPLGIVVGDVNYLKRTNDNLGHAAGDRLLKLVADTIMDNIAFGSFAARTGGDELVLLLPGGGVAAAERFVDSVNEAFGHINDDLVGQPSVSWGCSEMLTDSDNFDEKYNQADERMYADKKRRKAQRAD